MKYQTEGFADKYLKFKYGRSFVDTAEVMVQSMKRKLARRPAPTIRGAKFNQAVDGFRPHEFSVLCGATGIGKTTLVANWTFDLIQAGHKVYVAPIEIGPHNFMDRIMSVAHKDSAYQGHTMTKELRDKHLSYWHDELKYENLIMSPYETRIDRKQLMDDIAFAVEVKGVEVVFIDNINFILHVKNAKDQIVEMDNAIHDLVIMCKQLPAHIVMIMHPKKTDSGRVEDEFSVKGSATSVQECHNLFLFNRIRENEIGERINGKYGSFEDHDRELKFSKLRTRGEFSGYKLYYRNEGGGFYNEL